MDQSLSSLYPIHQIGSDGFSWWIGQVESDKKDDPKRSGRFRVRIIGQHLKTGENATATEELPWAHLMMPVTTPFIEGGTGGASPGLQRGCFVIGFYLDNDKQKPIIMGSVGGVKGATKITNDDPGSGPLNFTPFVDPKTNPKQHRSTENQSGKNEDDGNTDKGVVDADRADVKNGAPPALLAAYAKHSESNPTGGQSCITIANPNCGQENNLKSGLTKIIGDMLAANQASGGNIGDYYISKVNGLLYDGVGIARYHINRVVRLAKSFIARGKTEVTKALRGAVDFLTNALLTEETVVGNTGPLADPEKAFKPIKEKGNRFKKIKEIFDDIFKELGCSIADITDTISKFITDLLLGYITDVFNNAACFIDTLVDGILNEILAKFDELVNKILAPIQAILEAIAAPLNFIGGIINKFMKLLGITCTGPGQKCEPISQKCTDCATDDGGDDLDKLLKKIEEGIGDQSLFVCQESKQVPPPPTTDINFVGGVPNDFTPSEKNEVPSGDEVIEYFPPDDDDEFDDEDVPEDVLEDPIVIDDDVLPQPVLPVGDEPFLTIETAKSVYQEGESVTYLITGLNIPNGTILDWQLSGPAITTTDIVGDLGGQVTMNNNAAEVPVVIANDNVTELVPELLRMVVASANAITVDGTDFTPEAITDVVIDSNIGAPVAPDPSQVQVWNITTDKNSYQEGEDVLVTITTENVPDNTEVTYYMIGSGISASDFVTQSLSQTLVIKNNVAVFILGIEDDTVVEGVEQATIILVGKGVETSFNITETGTGGENEDDTGSDGGSDEDEFTITKPVAGEPITDDNGSLVYIPIVYPGGPYQTPPQVIISGGGYGAGAIALLDDAGFVSEVRVTRQGVNYTANTSDNNGVECIIDSFTLLAPGVGYTEVPEVYINGEAGVAEATIDTRGFVVSIRTLDRNRRFKSMPAVSIIGGNGAGARFLPNMACLDSIELERRGYAKIGTGSYIDCP
jgi:hypothetical protein